MYYVFHIESALLQEFFLLAGFTVCGGDSISFADLSAEGASNTYHVSDRASQARVGQASI